MTYLFFSLFIAIVSTQLITTSELGTSKQLFTIYKSQINQTFPGLALYSPQPKPFKSSLISIKENSNDLSGGLSSIMGEFENFFKSSFEFNLQKLPMTNYIYPSPWPSDYWATIKDGINVRWEGPSTLSAVEKYAHAYGLDVGMLTDGVSAYNGIDSLANSSIPCKVDSDCTSIGDGSQCGIRINHTSGWCVPSWYGICHAWSPAAILEPEPQCPVTVNGMTFSVMDIKALLTVCYDRTGIDTIFGANRCYENTTQTDQYGRITDNTCRDMTADFFHVMITNVVGRFNSSLVVDVDATSQVWNQPVRGYNVLNYSALTSTQAAQMISPDLTTYIFNTVATQFFYFKTSFSYVTEAVSYYPLAKDTDIVSEFTKELVFEYIIEADDSGNVIGGEWINDSKLQHLDFLWQPMDKPSMSTTVGGGIQYSVVQQLLKQSISGQCNV